MTRKSFNKLHLIIEEDLEKVFDPKGCGKRRPCTSRYCIDSKIPLSIALQFFAGSDPADLMQIHDVGLATMY